MNIEPTLTSWLWNTEKRAIDDLLDDWVASRLPGWTLLARVDLGLSEEPMLHLGEGVVW